MSNFIKNNKYAPMLFLVPTIWMTTGMLWDGNGDMRLVPIVLVVAAFSIFFFRFEAIIENFKSSFWIKLLFINGMFGAVAYGFYGFDSRELRATLIILVLLLVTPQYFYTKKAMQWGLFFAAVSCSIYGYYYQVYNYLPRSHWPINAIPFATICGLISISSLGILLTSFKDKSIFIIFLSIAFSVMGLLLSHSRGPLIAVLLVMSLLFFYISFRKSIALSIYVLIGLIVAILGFSKLPIVQERIDSTAREYHLVKMGDYSTSVGVRLQMLLIGTELWKDKPILGYGKEIKHEFNRLESEKRINSKVNRLISMTFHNGYVDKFVLYGVFGGLIFLMFLAYPIWLSIKYSFQSGAALLWPPALFVAICNLSDAPFINAQAAIYYMFIIGSVTMMLSSEKERE